jgi:hypothetical protein
MKNLMRIGLMAIIILTSTILQNCGSDDPAPKEDVYLAGFVDEGKDNYSVATIKNGVPTIIGGGDESESVNDITLDGDDLYAGGYTNDYTNMLYWKNGVKNFIPKDPDLGWEEIRKIIVRNGKKYMLAYGPGGTIAHRYYVDDVRKVLPTQGSAEGMDVASNGDVYVVGKNVSEHAAYWKNGVIKELYDGDSGATDIRIVGSDIYILGWYINDDSFPVPVIWKNEVMTEIGDPGAYPYKICVSGKNVYAVGEQTSDDAIIMWKNGEVLSLDTEGHSITRVYDLEVKNGNVYFLTEDQSTGNPLLFKNGTLLAPYDGSFEGELYAIALR